MAANMLNQLFHPSIADWFNNEFPAPTAVQSASWPMIASGQHVLITAPTGSGKTLTAFLWALNRFADATWETGKTRVLYISPLKALNNDIQRNLLQPLAELKQRYDFPAVSVQTRSGDTSQSARQRMLRRPPDILITTPESLALLLTTHKGRQALNGIETVILDEIHSIVDNRRGVQLMTSLERLVDISGEFQRLAVSATVEPLAAVAGYVGGFDLSGKARRLAIVDEPTDKSIEFRVRFPADARLAAENGKKIWDPLADSFRDIIKHNRSTLFFTNSRRLSEKITLKINEDQIAPLAYAHHGSLARDIRQEVEVRLKAGELKAIVATNSLEMGIDIGHLDEVVMVQSPASVASTLQRIGRAGHKVGETSLGTLYPTHAQDFLEAAVLAEAVARRDIEPLQPMVNALDVLAQIIISCCAQETLHLDELFTLLQRSSPYHGLPREHFDLVIEMLAGRYAGSRVRELKPRLSYDRINQTIKALKSAVFALYSAGGVIPDRGYYKLRHADSNAVIGELDEEFVWEASVGQTFTLGTQNWQIQRITHNDVLVRAARAGAQVPPFWRSDAFNRSFHFSELIGEFLEQADGLLADNNTPVLREDLEYRRGFEPDAAQELIDYLTRQRQATGGRLPNRHHLLIESIRCGPGGYRASADMSQLVIHTFWGGRLNRPWALALESKLREIIGGEPEIHADNNVIVITSREALDPLQVITWVTAGNLQTLLRLALEHSGFFGARFRECAARSLLLTRARFNQRLPLWMSRLQAKKLMTSVKSYSDFPVLLETWRTCLQDEFDLPALEQMLTELEDGTIEWSAVSSNTPSPFAGNVTFDQISRYMYADDQPEQRTASSLSDQLISSAIADEALRPRLLTDTVSEFVRKRQRLLAEYRPRDTADCLDWLKERVLIPEGEGEISGDFGGDFGVDFETSEEAVCWISDGPRRWLAHREVCHGLRSSSLLGDAIIEKEVVEQIDPRSAEQFAREILSFYGPLRAAQIDQLLPSVPRGLLDNTEAFVCGKLLDEDEREYFCDIDNYEILLRFQRARLRPEVVARPVADMPAFIAAWQRFGAPIGEDTLIEALHCLRGYRAPVRVWLRDLLSARLIGFVDHHLDEVLQQTQLGWSGSGNEAVIFGYPEDVELMTHEVNVSALTTETPDWQAAGFIDPQARYSFFQLADQQHAPLNEFARSFWASVWQGELTADSVAPLRQGLTAGFAIDPAPLDLRSMRSARRAFRSMSRGFTGNWQLRSPVIEEADALTELEDRKEIARLLLDRYGCLCRELANREGGRARWANLFKALCAMELAGEVVAGYFFEGLSGPQFVTPAALAIFRRPGIGDRFSPGNFWINALDPASPCGLGLVDDRLPQRRGQNYLSYVDGTLALVVENQGSRLNFYLPWDDDRLPVTFGLLDHLLETHKRIAIESINGEPGRNSPYLESLAAIYQAVKDHKQIYLESR